MRPLWRTIGEQDQLLLSVHGSTICVTLVSYIQDLFGEHALTIRAAGTELALRGSICNSLSCFARARPTRLSSDHCPNQPSRPKLEPSQIARLRLAPGSMLRELCEPTTVGLNLHSRPVNSCVTSSLEAPPQGSQHE